MPIEFDRSLDCVGKSSDKFLGVIVGRYDFVFRGSQEKRIAELLNNGEITKKRYEIRYIKNISVHGDERSCYLRY